MASVAATAASPCGGAAPAFLRLVRPASSPVLCVHVNKRRVPNPLELSASARSRGWSVRERARRGAHFMAPAHGPGTITAVARRRRPAKGPFSPQASHAIAILFFARLHTPRGARDSCVREGTGGTERSAICVPGGDRALTSPRPALGPVRARRSISQGRFHLPRHLGRASAIPADFVSGVSYPTRRHQ